jgi:UrcA family protein
MRPRLRSVRLATIALCAALCAGAGAATPSGATDDGLQVVVRYDDLRLDTDAGVRALHQRVTAAVRRVCPNYDTPDLGREKIVRRCRELAMARAVSQIGNERLAALESTLKPFG